MLSSGGTAATAAKSLQPSAGTTWCGVAAQSLGFCLGSPTFPQSDLQLVPGSLPWTPNSTWQPKMGYCNQALK